MPGFPFQFFYYRQLASDNAALATMAFLKLWHGSTMVEYLDRLGFMKPKTAFIHGIWLTPREIGILARTGRDVPLSRINDITFSHTFLERILGCGTLVIESAGERGQVTMTEVPRVERVQRELYDLVERTDNRLRGITEG